MPKFRQRDALSVLTKTRLLEIAEALELGLPGRLLKTQLIDTLAASPRAPFQQILELLKREELKAICRATGLDDAGREKAVIAARLLSHGRQDPTLTLTKADLVEAVAATSNLNRQAAEAIVKTTLNSLIESLQEGESVELRGFGSFRLRDRAARTARNPKSGAVVHVPAKRVCYFKPGKTLRFV